MSREQLMDEIQKQLSSPIPLRGASLGYRLGLGALSLFMMAMPIAYAALVAGVAMGLYHYSFTIFPSSLHHIQYVVALPFFMCC